MSKKKYFIKSIALLLFAFVVYSVDNKIEDKTNIFNSSKANTTIEADASNRISEEEHLNQLGLEKATINYVIDGDTYVLSDNRKVRIIGVNCPEDTSKKEICGDVATSYAKSTLEGQVVYLQKDSSDVDKYGRLLRIVWLEIPNELNEEQVASKTINALLVSKGLAKSMTVAPDTKYSNLFKSLTKQAKSKKQGMWSLSSNGTTSGDEI